MVNLSPRMIENNRQAEFQREGDQSQEFHKKDFEERYEIGR